VSVLTHLFTSFFAELGLCNSAQHTYKTDFPTTVKEFSSLDAVEEGEKRCFVENIAILLGKRGTVYIIET
jgi:hypothetical protein